MFDADIGKPTGPDPSKGQEDFLLACYPLLQTLLLDTRCTLGLRLSLFATKCHIPPLRWLIAARRRRWTMRPTRLRAVRRRSDSINSIFPSRRTETGPVKPFNKEEGINNPSLVCRSLLIGNSFQGRAIPLDERFDLCRKGLPHLTSHDGGLRRRALLLLTNCRLIGFENVALHGCHHTAVPL